jgi:catechol 2,3-dioxygenase-like lactoylglutathione lyase family enzyme
MTQSDSSIEGRLVAIDHVQLAMPRGEEDVATDFYEGLLGLRRVAKPPRLEARGGCWFEGDGVVVHLGVEDGFTAARKAHPAFGVVGLDALCERLAAAGVEVLWDDELPGVRRCYVADCFGNRIELIDTATTD